MADGSSENTENEAETKIYCCKKAGCSESFKHKTQLYRHKAHCSGKSPMKKKKEYVKENDYYRCLRCGKRYTHQAGVSRHLNKSCGVVKDKVIHQCTFCDKVFPYKSVLIRHEQTHIDDIAVP